MAVGDSGQVGKLTGVVNSREVDKLTGVVNSGEVDKLTGVVNSGEVDKQKASGPEQVTSFGSQVSKLQESALKVVLVKLIKPGLILEPSDPMCSM